MDRFLYTILLLLLACFWISCGSNEHKSDAYGAFEATEIIVSSESNGKLLAFNVEEGHYYEKGTELGCIDTMQLFLQIRQLESSIRAALARRPDMPTQVRSMQNQLHTLEREKQRIVNLVEANAISTNQLDDINAQINITQSQIAATKSTLSTQSQSILEEVEAMQFQKLQLENALEKCCIQSPVNGVILKKYIEANELAFQGKPLFKIADLINMFIKVYVTEDQLSELRLSQPVSIFMDAPNKKEKKFEGRIVWISSKAEFTPKMIQTKDERVNLVYAVKIAFVNDGSAKIGMPGDVKFEQ
jgi:HlyD family secretion protein